MISYECLPYDMLKYVGLEAMRRRTGIRLKYYKLICELTWKDDKQEDKTWW